MQASSFANRSQTTAARAHPDATASNGMLAKRTAGVGSRRATVGGNSAHQTMTGGASGNSDSGLFGAVPVGSASMHYQPEAGAVRAQEKPKRRFTFGRRKSSNR